MDSNSHWGERVAPTVPPTRIWHHSEQDGCPSPFASLPCFAQGALTILYFDRHCTHMWELGFKGSRAPSQEPSLPPCVPEQQVTIIGIAPYENAVASTHWALDPVLEMLMLSPLTASTPGQRTLVAKGPSTLQSGPGQQHLDLALQRWIYPRWPYGTGHRCGSSFYLHLHSPFPRWSLENRVLGL